MPGHADGACSAYELRRVVHHRDLAGWQAQGLAGQQVAGRVWLRHADLMGVDHWSAGVGEPVPGVLLAAGAVGGVAEDGCPVARAQARGKGC